MMKRVIPLIILMFCITVFIFSYGRPKTCDVLRNIPFDKNGTYSGFSDLPLNYSIEDAKEDGCFVVQNLRVVANKDVWDTFVKTSLHKENTQIRMALFYTESADSPYFLDLYYENGYYYLFDSTAENHESKPYLYLLTLEGKFGNPVRDSSVIVLTDDDTLTFDTIMKVLTSSNSEYIKSVSPFKVILYK
jgi:hypothetical protein